MADPFLAEIVMFGGNFAPRGWAFCDGQLLPIAQNSALFSLLGTIYGGDGRTTFGLPDLRGRVPIGSRQGAGLSNYREGQKGGVEQVVLNTLQIPSHNHSVTAMCQDNAGDQNTPAGHVWAEDGEDASTNYSDVAPNSVMHADAIHEQNVGGSQQHENRQPYLAINFIIATTGIFPSRS